MNPISFFKYQDNKNKEDNYFLNKVIDFKLKDKKYIYLISLKNNNNYEIIKSVDYNELKLYKQKKELYIKEKYNNGNDSILNLKFDSIKYSKKFDTHEYNINDIKIVKSFKLDNELIYKVKDIKYGSTYYLNRDMLDDKLMTRVLEYYENNINKSIN